MCINVLLHACMCMVVQRSNKSAPHPGTRVKDCCEQLCGYRELNPYSARGPTAHYHFSNSLSTKILVLSIHAK